MLNFSIHTIYDFLIYLFFHLSLLAGSIECAASFRAVIKIKTRKKSKRYKIQIHISMCKYEENKHFIWDFFSNLTPNCLE